MPAPPSTSRSNPYGGTIAVVVGLAMLALVGVTLWRLLKSNATHHLDEPPAPTAPR